MCVLMFFFFRTYPMHDSAGILLVRSNNYRKHVDSVREWYQTQHHNWLCVDGEKSQWWVWERVRESTLSSARRVQHYLSRITAGEYNYTLLGSVNLNTLYTCTCSYMYMYMYVHVCTYMNCHGKIGPVGILVRGPKFHGKLVRFWKYGPCG